MCAQETQKTEENERGVDLNINIYYGGRGIIDDPTIYVINKMQEVLEELRVHVERYNLYDGKTNITTLPQTLKEADGIILATTVEWYGIGGSFWMPAGCMGIKRRSREFICVRS